ncbi:hypothetical protein WOB59_00090 [Methylocystis sp. IM4]|uniref:hypothetical protein n=1 Tax=Methylocystis sp. IM4 TaxID=3136560 RepID=UPI003119B8FC
MEPNKHLVTILTFVLTGGGSQAGLAKILDMDTAQLSKIKNGQEPWPERRLAVALTKLNAWAFDRSSAPLEMRDFYENDTCRLVNKLALPVDEMVQLIARLRIAPPPPPQPAPVPIAPDDPIRKLRGNWVNLYICTNPNAKSERAVAVDNFVVSPSNEPFLAVLRHTNYEHADRIIPEGTVRLKINILEIDIDYKERRFPLAKYLASWPPTESINHLLTASLDIKEQARTVVARPTLLVRVDEDVEQPGIYDQHTALFAATKKFFGAFAAFDESRNELCPRREVTEDDCDEVVALIKKELQGKPLRTPPEP